MNSVGWSVQPQAGCKAPGRCRKTGQGLLWGLIKVASELGKILMETQVQEGKGMQSSGVWLDKAGQAEEWWVLGRGGEQC